MHTCFPSISQLEISQSPTTTIPHLHQTPHSQQTTSFTTNTTAITMMSLQSSRGHCITITLINVDLYLVNYLYNCHWYTMKQNTLLGSSAR